MGLASGGALLPNRQYYEIRGRAAEISRALGSQVAGAEHLFLGMLHDGGWPVTVISPLADPGRAEAAVLGIIGSPGYTAPSLPRFLSRDVQMQMWGADIAVELGDSYLGLEHAFLAMIRSRETVPARALAGLADLDALEAAVLAARSVPTAGPPADEVFRRRGTARLAGHGYQRRAARRHQVRLPYRRG
jgi:Clp amino terminal domain, pathogenicity island component